MIFRYIILSVFRERCPIISPIVPPHQNQKKTSTLWITGHLKVCRARCPMCNLVGAAEKWRNAVAAVSEMVIEPIEVITYHLVMTNIAMEHHHF